RATGIPSTVGYFRAMLTPETLTAAYKLFTHWELLPVAMMLAVEWLNRGKEHGLQGMADRCPRWLRCIGYAFVLLAIIYFRGGYTPFVYFQF
ncbi:MAG: hypothetical protein IJU19_00035, partial [Bacteroidales bacterium]|nr:hypothetical protein [Bacteroidales bacterium]